MNEYSTISKPMKNRILLKAISSIPNPNAPKLTPNKPLTERKTPMIDRITDATISPTPFFRVSVFMIIPFL